MPASIYHFLTPYECDNLVYVSGQLGNKFGSAPTGGIAEQSAQAINNIETILQSGFGLTLESVIECQVFLVDMKDWPVFNSIYVKRFKPPYPARSSFGATGLALGGLVEIKCMASMPERVSQ